MKSFIPLILTFIGLAAASLNLRDDCHSDNCLRAVAGTRLGPGQASTASADCSLFLKTTITPSATTVYITTTTTLPPSSFNTFKQKRQTARATIPPYASQCTDAAGYSSACSCFGVTPATITAPTPTLTSTVTVTASPTCSANLNTDPNNCGKCGNVCPPGSVCENGSCSISQCKGQTCSTGFFNCENNDNCFCFTGATGAGFCAQNAICTLLTGCANDDDCGVGSGDICALNTCCPFEDPKKPGVCLSPQCSNPAMKLMQMARVKRSTGGTAAFK